MSIIFKEYSKVVWQKKWYFLLCIIGLSSATILDFYVPVLYKNIANGFAADYSPATHAMMLHNLLLIAVFYAGVWLSWRVLEIGIIPVDGGGMSLLEKRCFDVLKKRNYSAAENYRKTLLYSLKIMDILLLVVAEESQKKITFCAHKKSADHLLECTR
jgi:ATP-binding cassette subfamily B protein